MVLCYFSPRMTEFGFCVSDRNIILILIQESVLVYKIMRVTHRVFITHESYIFRLLCFSECAYFPSAGCLPSGIMGCWLSLLSEGWWHVNSVFSQADLSWGLCTGISRWQKYLKKKNSFKLSVLFKYWSVFWRNKTQKHFRSMGYLKLEIDLAYCSQISF